MSTSSLHTYPRPWKLFREFCSDRLHNSGPNFPDLDRAFGASFYSISCGTKVCCFNSFNLHFITKLSPSLSFPPRPYKMDMIQLALRGYSKMNPSHDTRLLISLPLLEKSISACDHTQSSVYGSKMTPAMYAMAFFAAIRVGEITCRPTQPRRNVIFLSQIVFMKNREGVVSAFKVPLRNYTHSDPAVPVDIFLYREKILCPVSAVLAYLELRDTSPDSLFCWRDASPISRTYLTKALSDALRYCNPGPRSRL